MKKSEMNAFPLGDKSFVKARIKEILFLINQEHKLSLVLPFIILWEFLRSCCWILVVLHFYHKGEK